MSTENKGSHNIAIMVIPSSADGNGVIDVEELTQSDPHWLFNGMKLVQIDAIWG